MTTRSKVAKYPDYVYMCAMPSADTEGMRTMLRAFSARHGMSFQWGPLDREGRIVAIELTGHGARMFAVNDDVSLEFYLDIRPYGREPGYEALAVALSDDLVAELKKMPGVVAKWERVPVSYNPTVPPASRAVRGPPPE